jgi:hypothetical protein
MADDAPPEWNQDKADWLIGKTVLVGITCVASDGATVTSQSQYYGKIIAAERNKGISIACEGQWSGQTELLPPDLRAFEPANPGEYRLRSTGEVVKDPDILSTWTVNEPPPKS